MDRSIEGDASIRVGFDQQSSGCISFLFHLSVWQNTLKGTREFSHSVVVMSLRLLYYYFYVTYVMPFYTCGYRITFTCGYRKSIPITVFNSYLAVGCKHTGCKSCYGQGLELGGFTMPLLGIPHSKAIHFTLNSMNSPTFVLTL